MNSVKLLKLAVSASIDAGKKILEIYETSGFRVDQKADDSPLTIADKASNNIIIKVLGQTDIPIISEESKLMNFADRKNWDAYWLVDPLDGTKEFIKKNGEFTVNIALCKGPHPILGVIYVPVSRELYYGIVDMKKAFKTILDLDHKLDFHFFNEQDRIRPSKKAGNLIRVVGSRSHMNTDTQNYIDSLEQSKKQVEIISKGSSLKFCLVAEGSAHVYPRFAPTMEWDTAAGHAICNATGLKVLDQRTGNELKYNKENLLNPYFLVTPN